MEPRGRKRASWRILKLADRADSAPEEDAQAEKDAIDLGPPPKDGADADGAVDIGDLVLSDAGDLLDLDLG
jgi:hypothetical protein